MGKVGKVFKANILALTEDLLFFSFATAIFSEKKK
jgi:hypothetical protein